MSCILVTWMYILNVVVALESPCGAIPSYALYPPTSQPRAPTAVIGIPGERSAGKGPYKIPRPPPRPLTTVGKNI